jgi:hypothetical protein
VASIDLQRRYRINQRCQWLAIAHSSRGKSCAKTSVLLRKLVAACRKLVVATELFGEPGSDGWKY